MWFDPIIGRLNRDERGEYLGNFGSTDNILVIYKDGSYELTNFDLTNHYVSNEVLLVKKFDPKLPITALYYDGGQKQHFIKRFTVETSSLDKKFVFISDTKNSKLILASTAKRPRFEIVHAKNEKRDQLHEEFVVEDLIDIRGWKAMGYKLSIDKFKEIRWLEPLAEPEPIEEAKMEIIEDSADESDDQSDENQGEDQGSATESGESDIQDSAEPSEILINNDTLEVKDPENTKEVKPKKAPKKEKDPDSEKSQLGLFE